MNAIAGASIPIKVLNWARRLLSGSEMPNWKYTSRQARKSRTGQPRENAAPNNSATDQTSRAALRTPEVRPCQIENNQNINVLRQAREPFLGSAPLPRPAPSSRQVSPATRRTG